MPYPTSASSKSTITSSLTDAVSVPTYGSGGSFTVRSEVQISASPSVARQAMLDTTTWGEWNTFTNSCTITSPSSSNGVISQGAKLTTTYTLSGPKKEEQKLEVSVVDEARIAWISLGKSKWQLWSERVMEFRDDGEGGCQFVCFETFGGLLAGAAKGKVGPLLVERFGDVARDLKGFVEK